MCAVNEKCICLNKKGVNYMYGALGGQVCETSKLIKKLKN
jgi:hypothetical protein